MNNGPKIIVLTPVKNEAWILERFLDVTSRFADCILVADQNSTDASAEICRGFDKVVLLRNNSDEYDEASRQNLLIGEARRRVPGAKILLALDADEILAADALRSADWDKINSALPGTVLFFEKPDLIGSTARCLRWPNNYFPMGFVDDDRAAHKADRIHSIRVPVPEGAPRLHLQEIKFLHYGLTRKQAQLAKIRYYAVQENLSGTNPLHRRRGTYGNYEWSYERDLANDSEPSLPGWFTGWEQQGIDLQTIQEDELRWQDIEVLKIFAKHGTRRFWWDDIWHYDWEACRRQALSRGIAGLPNEPVLPPPFWVLRAAQGLDVLLAFARHLHQIILRERSGSTPSQHSPQLPLARSMTAKLEKSLKPFLELLGRIVVKLASYDTRRLRMHVAGSRIQGPENRVIVGKKVDMQNAFLNTVCGTITFGDNAFCGQNCMFLTGRHDYTLKDEERQAHPDSGQDIVIGRGAWICSGAIVLGGVRIADHAVIAAGAVVTADCPVAGVYAGIPARLVKTIEFRKETGR